MPKRIAINGFGRIGRAAFKIAFSKEGVKIVAINDLTDTKTLAYLLQYDSVYNRYHNEVEYDENNLIVDGQKIPVYKEKDPALLPWKKMKVDVVMECTGVFETKIDLQKHLDAGAKRVVLSSPSKDKDVQTLVFGTNITEKVIGKNQPIVSNASCTTNCIAPVMQILSDKFGIEKALMTTIHAYTATQRLVDSPDPKDLRRGRAGAINIVPSTTGAAKALYQVVPEVNGIFDGIAVRVPVPCGSLSDIVAVLKKEVTVEEVNKAFVDYAKKAMYKGIVGVTGDNDELVSSDLLGTNLSTVVDLKFTRVVGGNLVKVLAWYDNEWGYSNRLVEMALEI
ncbi:MAG: type I glyceraldehyde-3-phosphate dehydrogenase [bacterium]